MFILCYTQTSFANKYVKIERSICILQIPLVLLIEEYEWCGNQSYVHYVQKENLYLINIKTIYSELAIKL